MCVANKRCGTDQIGTYTAVHHMVQVKHSLCPTHYILIASFPGFNSNCGSSSMQCLHVCHNSLCAIGTLVIVPPTGAASSPGYALFGPGPWDVRHLSQKRIVIGVTSTQLKQAETLLH